MNLSIIIPMYNCSKTISRTLNSILAQNNYGLKYEIICIDDHSEDDTFDIVSNEFKDTVILFTNPQKGVSSARNYGLKQANGKYVTFVDSDDLVVYNYFELISRYVKEYDICFFDYYFGDKRVTCSENLEEELYKGVLFNNVWNKFYLNNFLRKNNITFHEDLKIGEDLVFNVDCYLKTKNIKYFKKKYIYQYLINDFSTMSVSNKSINVENKLHYFDYLIPLDNKFYDDFVRMSIHYVRHNFRFENRQDFNLTINEILIKSNSYGKLKYKSKLGLKEKIYWKLIKYKCYRLINIIS